MSRRGFTLIEMLVAMALTIFVMLILSECFILGLQTFSGLKAIGDLQEELRTAVNIMRADLKEDHFEGKRRLSDPVGTFTGNWALAGGVTAAQVGTVPERIKEGFFAIGQSYPQTAPQKIKEGFDDGVSSYRVFDHWLHFSVKMRGNARERFFATAHPYGTASTSLYASSGIDFKDAAFFDFTNGPNATPTLVRSPWAEIAYFLVRTGTTIDPKNAGSNLGTPLFALYRLQYVVLADPADANNKGLPYLPGVCSLCAVDGANPAKFCGPSDLAKDFTWRAFNPYTHFAKAPKVTPPVSANRTPYPATLVLSNVVSFQVQVMTNPPQQGAGALGLNFGDQTGNAPISAATNTGDLLLAGNMPFDTANYIKATGSTVQGVAPTFSIMGLQITLRIWDPRSKLTRQVTFIQDM